MIGKGLLALVVVASALSPWSAVAEKVTAAWLESEDFSDNETHRGVIYFGKRMFRFDPERKGDMNASVIFRGDRQQLVVLDHNRKTYFVLDDQVINRVSSQLGNMMAQMEARIANLPPDQREMARRMMQQRLGSTGTSTTQDQTPHRVEKLTETKKNQRLLLPAFRSVSSKAKGEFRMVDT